MLNFRRQDKASHDAANKLQAKPVKSTSRMVRQILFFIKLVGQYAKKMLNILKNQGLLDTKRK
ncbi:MAG: hypothetical protein N4A62_08920 [Marinisporobacter sp.]|nr:hypothetical protein [Marinisporobacter sp.]